MKRLFVLRQGKGGPLITDYDGEPVAFEDKMVAKRVRDRIKGAVVSPGPDHKDWEG